MIVRETPGLEGYSNMDESENTVWRVTVRDTPVLEVTVYNGCPSNTSPGGLSIEWRVRDTPGLEGSANKNSQSFTSPGRVTDNG
ncbi:unnamed protein product [Coregonus sp. 'balchen']|nr:unnamed protein product [Coregonus sp. 'balchen']